MGIWEVREQQENKKIMELMRAKGLNPNALYEDKPRMSSSQLNNLRLEEIKARAEVKGLNALSQEEKNNCSKLKVMV